MNVKKTIRKVAALGAATAMVGATLFGAVAQSYTLGDYPQPFVMEGVFDPAQAVIVVGKDAAVSDVLGAIELAASLQADAVTIEPVQVGSTSEPSVSDGVKIARSGEDLNYNEMLADIDSKLTDQDLPGLLADGTFDDSEGATDNEVDFTQDVTFDGSTGELVYEKNDETDTTGSYLKFPKGTTMYTYAFDFDGDSVTFDGTATNDDFEGVMFEFQGTEYTITSARDDTDVVDRLKLLVGDVVKWVAQDAPVNVGDHTVTVISVDENGDKCGVEVDGETKWLTVGETKTVGGLEVGVLDAIAVHAELKDQDTCELSLGSQEVLLEEGQEVSINGEKVDGSNVAFQDSGAETWDGFTITYEPDDDMWLAAGESFTDPVLGNWKVMYEGVTANTELVSATGGSTSGKVTFKNLDGATVEVPYRENAADDGVMFGDDEDYEGFLNGGAKEGQIAFDDADYCDQADVTDCEGVYFMGVSSGDEARLLELVNIDEADLKATVKDLSTGKTFVETFVEDTDVDVDVGFMEVTLNFDLSGDRVTFVNIDYGDVKTELGAVLNFAESDDSGILEFNLTENPDETSPAPVTVLWNLTENSDDEVEIVGLTGVSLDQETDGSDDEIGTTAYGTVVRMDTENGDKVEFTYPEEAAYANVFVAPVNAKVMAGGESGVNAEKVNRIPVGMSVLDVDAESMSKHMLVVGGPCANIIADEVTGTKDSCVEGFEEGKAKIATFARKGKTVVLVAGYSAQDTLAAAYVLADYKEYPQLTGNAVELAVASLSDVTFVGTTA